MCAVIGHPSQTHLFACLNVASFFMLNYSAPRLRTISPPCSLRSVRFVRAVLSVSTLSAALPVLSLPYFLSVLSALSVFVSPHCFFFYIRDGGGN